MKFLKENSYYITRLLITHLGMAVFGTVMMLSTINRGNALLLAAGIFSAVFYAVLVYATMWEAGAKDRLAINAGRMKLSSGKGFVISTIAQAIIILLTVAFFIASFLDNSDFAKTVYAVCYYILVLLDGCFTGIMLFLNNVLGKSDLLIASVYILGSLFVSAVSAFAYVMGTKELRIIPKKDAGTSNTAKKD